MLKIKSLTARCLIFIMLILMCSSAVKADNQVNYIEQFGREKGCAIFYDSALNEYDIYNKDIVYTEVSPCSTFKIILTLAGIEKGVLQNENTIFEWDGVTRELPQWNKDLNLKESFKCSAIWWFYKVFNKVGKETVEEIIQKISYGNMDSTAEGKFWLGSSLKISAFEQVVFLKKLFSYEFNFKRENIEILKNIMFVEEIDGCKIYGKTGANVDNKIGWFVGFYEKNENKTYFAVRTYDGENISGVRAREIAKDIIKIKKQKETEKMILLHAAKQSDWENAQKSGLYGEFSIEKDGFIHCSKVEDMSNVANDNLKKIKEPLLLLCINTGKLKSEIKWEQRGNKGIAFPHIYGLLNTDAVIYAVEFPRDDKGNFYLPEKLLTYMEKLPC